MDQVRQFLSYHHYSYRTEQTYCDWLIRFVKFHSNQWHPKDMGKTEIEAFLSHLATNRKVAASTQRQALNALVFLYKHVFPAKKLSKDLRSDKFRRHHVLESGLQKAVKIAVDRAGITKRVSTHTLRHSVATHLLEDGVNIRVVQELMGHADVKTTETYTHVVKRHIRAVISPLENL